MSETEISNIANEIINDDSFILDMKQQVDTAHLLNSLEEVQLDLLEAKMTILEKDMEIIDLKRKLLDKTN